MPRHCFRKTNRQEANRRFVDARTVMAEYTPFCTTVPKVFEVLATSFASGNGELTITVFVSTAVTSSFALMHCTIGS